MVEGITLLIWPNYASIGLLSNLISHSKLQGDSSIWPLGRFLEPAPIIEHSHKNKCFMQFCIKLQIHTILQK